MTQVLFKNISKRDAVSNLKDLKTGDVYLVAIADTDQVVMIGEDDYHMILTGKDKGYALSDMYDEALTEINLISKIEIII